MDRTMRPGERIFLACVLLFVAGFLAVGFAEGYRLQIFRYPAGLGILLLTLGLIVLLGGRAAKAQEPEPADEPAPATVTGLLAAWGCVLAILPAVYLLGYAVGLPAFVGAFVGLRTGKWKLAAALAAGVFVVTYVGFHRLFMVPLPLWPIGLR